MAKWGWKNTISGTKFRGAPWGGVLAVVWAVQLPRTKRMATKRNN